MLSDLPQGLWAVDCTSNSFKVVALWLSWACLIGDIWKRGRGVSVVRTQQGTAFKSWLINFTVKAGWNKSCGNVKQRLLRRTRRSCATELNIIKRTLQPLKANSWQIIHLLSTAKQAWRNELSQTVACHTENYSSTERMTANCHCTWEIFNKYYGKMSFSQRI